MFSPEKFSFKTLLGTSGGLVILASLLVPQTAVGQGCVIARGGGCHMPAAHIIDQPDYFGANHWQVSVAHRWFRSDRHFVGREEQPHRQEEGTQVINNSNFIDVTLTFAPTRRMWFDVTLPYSWHDRSSLYEHMGNSSGQRFHTQADGIGDVRATANMWVLSNENPRRGNFAIGLGFKAPTADYNARDTFQRPNGPESRYVDSSIQPGDGGWGATISGQGFYQFAPGLVGYANGFYLFNPSERIPETRFSIPDSYMARAGLTWIIPRVEWLAVSGGGRIEGVPSEDVFGGSEGSRRPGYTIAVEPGFSISKGRFYFEMTVPIAVERNRTRTYGATRTGDAAFADFTVNSTFSYRF